MRVTVNKAKIEAFVVANELGSHRDFARKAGVADVTWWRIWTGERAAGSRVISRIMSAYKGSEFDDFFCVDSIPTGNGQGEATS